MSDKNQTERPIQDARIGQLPERLTAAIGTTSVRAIADKAGISEGTVRNLLGGATPRLDNILRIADATGVSASWLATGEGTMVAGTAAPGGAQVEAPVSASRQVKEANGEYDLVPLYDVRAAAGHGAVVEDEQVIDSLAFKRQWIQQELHASPGDLYLIYVDGESMEPTLRPGDVILVDRRSAEAVPRDGIYVLRMDGSLLVKRVQRLPGRQVKVTSDNPAYEPFNLSLETPGEDLAIVGRVVWAGRRM